MPIGSQTGKEILVQDDMGEIRRRPGASPGLVELDVGDLRLVVNRNRG